MTRGPAALALAALLSAYRTGSAAPCAPRADLDGDAAAVVRVAAELKRLGDTTGGASDGCIAVPAQVALDESGGIAVSVRSERRIVSDAALAAVWIDSWLHDELDGTWRGEAAPAVEVHAAAAAPARDPLDRFALAASYETGWGSDGSSWTGASGAACVMLGRVCIGARGRYAEQSLAGTLTRGTRSDLSALATASTPVALGRMIASPELGVGVGRMSTSRVEGCTPVTMPINCDPADPVCGMTMGTGNTCTDAAGNIYVGDKLDTATVTPRLSAALRVSVTLFEHVSLEALAAITYAPLGHADPYAVKPTVTPAGTSGSTSLPGEPSAAFQLGIGLRIGAP